MITEHEFDVKKLLISFYSDITVLSLSVIILIFSCIISVYISILFGLIASFAYAAGCTLVIVALQHKQNLAAILQKVYDYVGLKPEVKVQPIDCDVCGVIKCNRHLTAPNREPWRGLFITKELDDALASFYTKILNAFVESWFSLLSKNEDFVNALKDILREATCRLILKFKDLNIPRLITDKLLPCALNHHKIVQKMINEGVNLDKLADQFHANEYQIHPAVRNRQSELDYLRAVSKCLLPRLCNNQNLDSKVFFSLGRELLACWVLLPLMDILANPNWLNAMIIAATDRNSSSKNKLVESKVPKVMFLANFIEKSNNSNISKNQNFLRTDKDTEFLTDQHQLYMFMQFLKREGAVDILRFYLDVDNLNAELQDPKVTTDPAKLSTLQQQSETLLKAYQAMMEKDFKEPVQTLAEAQEDVKKCLKGKWQKAFHLTPEYFRMIYGSREIPDSGDVKSSDIQSGSVSRFGSKLKGAIRGAIDGAPLEATEVPTVWDALTDEQQPNSTSIAGNSTIYNSVTQKLRKERGQNLDAFICTFMQSIEQSTDIGEDVIEMRESRAHETKPNPPGFSLIFGNLFGIKTYKPKNVNHTAFAEQCDWIQGPSQCLIYILSHILGMTRIIIHFVLGLINISKSTIDALLCKGIDKLLRLGLYEPRLTLLITNVEQELFGVKKPDPSITELLEQQRQAKKRLSKISSSFATVADTIQSPSLNKQLMYCLFDMIVAELYPELEINSAEK